jgi:hypothetical protein
VGPEDQTRSNSGTARLPNSERMIGGPCAASSDCLAGSCVGGTCCDGVCGRGPMPEASADGAPGDGPRDSADAASDIVDSGEAPDATTSSAGLGRNTSRGCSCRTAASNDRSALGPPPSQRFGFAENGARKLDGLCVRTPRIESVRRNELDVRETPRGPRAAMRITHFDTEFDP